MPYEIINRLRAPSLLRVTGGTTGALPLSAFSANVNTENVTSLIITSMKWSVDPPSGTAVITRDSLVVATLYGADHWGHDEFAIANTPGGTITVAVTAGTVLLTLKKDATYNVDTYKL